MRDIYHFVWNYSENDERFLQENGIKYTWYNDGTCSWLIVDVDKKSPYFSCISEMAKDPSRIHWLEFTPRELMDAKLLTMRARIHSIELGRSETVFRYEEPLGDHQYNHRFVNTSTFFIGKPIKWGKRHFVASYEIGRSHLFCDDYAAEALSEYEMVNLLPVYHQRTGLIMDNVHYLCIDRVLPFQAVSVEGVKEYTCETCGKKVWTNSSGNQLVLLQKELPENISLAKTPDMWGASIHYPQPINIISHEVYALLVDKKLTNNLVFEPVILK